MRIHPWHAAVAVGLLLLLPLVALAQEPPPPEKQAPKDQATKPRLDLYGDPLPKLAIARIGTVRFRHGGKVLSVSFSPDGSTIASGTQDGSIHIWHPASGKELALIRPEGGLTRSNYSDVGSVAFSPDGKKLAAGLWDDSVGLWDVNSRDLLDEVKGGHPHMDVKSVAYSPDGRLLAWGGDEAKVHVWNPSKGEEVQLLQGNSRAVLAVAFSPDGGMIAAGGWDPAVRLFDVVSGERIRVFETNSNRVESVVFSPDGRWIATGGDSRTDETVIHLWDRQTGKEYRRMPCDDAWVFSVVFSPDGESIAAGDLVGVLRAWETETGKPKYRVQAAHSTIHSLSFSPDGKIIAGGCKENTIRLWDATDGSPVHPERSARSATMSIEFSPDGKIIASGGQERTVRLYSTETLDLITTLRGYGGRISAMRFTPDGRSLITAPVDDDARVWSTSEWKETHRLKDSGSTEYAGLTLSPDGRSIATWENGNSLKCWRLGSNEVNLSWVLDSGGGFGVRYRGCLFGGYPDIVGFSPWGDLLAAPTAPPGKIVYLLDSSTGQNVLSLEGHEDQVFAVAFSPDGSLLATGGETGVLRLWEVWSGEEVLRWEAHPFGITSLVFSSDGNVLVSASWDETIRAWEPATGKPLGVLRGHRGDVACVRFSPDGRTLASAGGDSTILFWDVANLGWDRESKTEDLDATNLGDLWNDLAGGDARRGYKAIDRLTRSSQVSLGFLRERMRVPPDPMSAKIQEKVRELDHSEFETRDRANEFLMQNGEEARPALRNALEGSPSPEVRERATAILSVPLWPFRDFPNELLARQRAMEALERMGSIEARAILKHVAESSPWGIERRHAGGAVGRLDGLEKVR